MVLPKATKNGDVQYSQNGTGKPTPDLFGGCQNCRIFYLPRIIGKGVVGTMEHEELLAQNAIDGHDLKAWSGGAPWSAKQKETICKIKH